MAYVLMGVDFEEKKVKITTFLIAPRKNVISTKTKLFDKPRRAGPTVERPGVDPLWTVSERDCPSKQELRFSKIN